MDFSDRIGIGFGVLILLALLYGLIKALTWCFGWWTLLIIPIVLSAYLIGTTIAQDGNLMYGLRRDFEKIKKAFE